MTIPSSLFSTTLTQKQVDEITEKYSDPKWERTLGICNASRFKVTNNALKLAQMIKDQLDIVVFPLIFTVGHKGWTDGPNFNMFSEDKTYTFHYSSEDYLKKGVKLETIGYRFEDDVEITIKKD